MLCPPNTRSKTRDLLAYDLDDIRVMTAYLIASPFPELPGMASAKKQKKADLMKLSRASSEPAGHTRRCPSKGRTNRLPSGRLHKNTSDFSKATCLI